jgi:hypothetical protein
MSRKPEGLWVSDDNEEPNWKSWCTEEEFNLYGLALAYEIHLTKDHNIIILTEEREVIDFSNEFQMTKERGRTISFELNWRRVAMYAEGVIISPYHWSLRLEPDHLWYNGWDCASGVIWNPCAIAFIKQIK